MKALHRTRLVLEGFTKAIKDGGIGGEYLASCAAQYVLIVFYSEVEQAVVGIVRGKLRSEARDEGANFIEKLFGDRIGRVKAADLRKVVSHFDKRRGELFDSFLAEYQLAKYGNFLTARHAVAHGDNVAVSWQDVKDIAEIGESVLGAFEKAITEALHADAT
jgi:hypothetical protein